MLITFSEREEKSGWDAMRGLPLVENYAQNKISMLRVELSSTSPVYIQSIVQPPPPPVPCGLVVRIRRSHRRGRGSIPRMGDHNFFAFSFCSVLFPPHLVFCQVYLTMSRQSPTCRRVILSWILATMRSTTVSSTITWDPTLRISGSHTNINSLEVQDIGCLPFPPTLVMVTWQSHAISPDQNNTLHTQSILPALGMRREGETEGGGGTTDTCRIMNANCTWYHTSNTYTDTQTDTHTHTHIHDTHRHIHVHTHL